MQIYRGGDKIGEIQEYRPPKVELDREIQDRDKLNVMEQRLWSARNSVEYHEEQLVKYKAEVAALEETIATLEKRLDKTDLEIKEVE
jgi:predicted  nucleic acid-binding Zn-ribbon protein